MNDQLATWIVVLFAGAFCTHIWRWFGVFFAGQLDADNNWIVWARAVATALIAGIIAKLILFPSGELVNVSLFTRLAATGTGVAAYYFLQKKLLIGVVAGEICFIVLISLGI